MPRFRKKPVVIEAMLFNEDSRDKVIAWVGDHCCHRVMDYYGCLQETRNLFIKTREGEMMAQPGDWIIKGVAGEFYPCKSEIFDATYEPVP